MSEKNAIVVAHVSKNFKLPHEKTDSVKGLFVNPFKRRGTANVETQHALRDINFSVKKGEFFGIVGRNGSGKSTLLKLIANIYQPTKGKVSVDGRLVPFIELGVGFNPELTGRENVYLNGALMGFSDKEIDGKYNAIVDFAELERFMDQKLKNYSSGMQVRLAFSVATILADSEVLLIDEVLAVGDADFQRKCFNYFKALKKKKKTVVFVSHDMDAVREYCDRAVLIDHAKLVTEGTSEHVAEQYTKLFTDLSTTPGEVDSTRWGDGTARIVSPQCFVTESAIVIEARVDFLQSLTNPTIGFLIKDAAGTSVCGTNNKVLRRKLGTFEAGDHTLVRWEMENIFSTATYTADIAVTKDDGITQADWWSDCLVFNNTTTYNTPHPISPTIRMTTKQD